MHECCIFYLTLGNQASDAESTDSEDENPLNHAGVWTLEECVRICKEKMTRLRYLYSQQFKRLNYTLREERRKMINEYDMDAFVLANVGFDKHSGNVLLLLIDCIDKLLGFALETIDMRTHLHVGKKYKQRKQVKKD